MTYTTATFDDVVAYGGGASVLGEVRRAVVGGVILGVGSVSVVAAAVGVVTVTAGWLISTSLATNPDFRADTPTVLETAASMRPYRTLAGTAALIAAAPMAAGPTRASDLVREAELMPPLAPMAAPAAAPPLAPRRHVEIPLPPRAPERATEIPLPPQRPNEHINEIALAPQRASASANEIALASATPARGNDIPLPPQRPAEHTNETALAPERAYASASKVALASPAPARANKIPLQPQKPAPLPLVQAKEEELRSPAPPAPPATGETKAVAVASVSPLPSFTFFKLIKKHLEPQLAYNSPQSPPNSGGHTAVYDIVAHTVYLPDGERLEAHSGLGYRLDDPRYVSDKARGPTPPHLYDLVLREAPFHGVRALRLNPVGDGAMYGRGGILAHTYMLGPSGQSFGCVSFRDYKKFLHAFLRGEIDRIRVVAHLGNSPADTIRARREPGGRYAFNYQ